MRYIIFTFDLFYYLRPQVKYLVFDTQENEVEEVKGSIISEYIDAYGSGNLNIDSDLTIDTSPFDAYKDICLISEGTFAFVTDTSKSMQYIWYQNKVYSLEALFYWTVNMSVYENLTEGVSYDDFIKERAREIILRS